jgi:BirA family biotin operon repressor/biotin-[acetyl-CoA-carboxylase] ligase
MSQLAALSLVAGVAVAEALEHLGVSGHSLKWPNDLIADGRKLAGILVEVSGEADGPATAIVGVGINVATPAKVGSEIDQPWIDLSTMASNRVSRNALAGVTLDRLINACASYADGGIEPFLRRWAQFDRLPGEPVNVVSGDRVVSGTYAGIAADGALILHTAAGIRHYHAGEVSLRRRASA